jgi:heme A synthase
MQVTAWTIHRKQERASCPKPSVMIARLTDHPDSVRSQLRRLSMKYVAPSGRVALVLALSLGAYVGAPAAAFAACSPAHAEAQMQVSQNDPNPATSPPAHAEAQTQVSQNASPENSQKPAEAQTQVSHNDATDSHAKPQLAAADVSCQ